MTIEYRYDSAERTYSQVLVANRILHHLRSRRDIKRVLEAGCGNGGLADSLNRAGFEVAGFDTSTSGIDQARRAFPQVQFDVASVYDDLFALFGSTFDACVASEVIEHVYDPRRMVSRIFDVVRPGGWFILTTPYHGYLKNLAIAITGKMDDHFTALWDGGHIKFWSRATLSALLEEAGFGVVAVEGVGRVPLLWKGMIVVARKPVGAPPTPPPPRHGLAGV